MRYLLDTHPFLWLVEGDQRLPAKIRELYENPGHEWLLSLASAWELAIKISIGKLILATNLHDLLERAGTEQGLQWLPISLSHVKQVATLPFHHRDPFDRLLASQALIERIELVSQDGAFDAYGVTRVW